VLVILGLSLTRGGVWLLVVLCCCCCVEQQKNPHSWVPFGNGPRVCLGARFALMEALTVLAYLLHKVRVGPGAETGGGGGLL
jgi:hypothetical protein